MPKPMVKSTMRNGAQSSFRTPVSTARRSLGVSLRGKLPRTQVNQRKASSRRTVSDVDASSVPSTLSALVQILIALAQIYYVGLLDTEQPAALTLVSPFLLFMQFSSPATLAEH